MKSFICLLLVSFIFNSTMGRAESEQVQKFYSVDKEFNKSLEGIFVKFQNPLRDIDENLKRYSELIVLFNKFKALDIDLGQRLLNKVNKGDALSGDDLYYLKRTINTYYKMNKKMLDFAKAYNFGGFEMAKTFATPDQHLPLVKAHLIYLSGHIQVLDHIVKMQNLYYESSGLFRRIIKNALKDRDHVGEKTLNDLLKMSEYTINIGNNKNFANQINLVRNIKEDLEKIVSNEPQASELILIIATNETAGKIAQGKRDFDISYHNFLDTIAGAFSKITGWLSSIFGNIAGNIRWRKGYFYNNENAIAMMKEKLKPMDVLLEKSPFVLTDKFIPGHYGHAALYLGTREQLESVNMWSHPDIIPYQDQIESGKVILEAIRSGVKLSSVEEFSNIDEVTIMRKKDALENADFLIESISRGLDQVGKDYDFNFDVETLDKIVCSELIYIVYGQVHWPTKDRLGRATISPDDIAEIIFQNNSKFKIEQYIVSPERGVLANGSIPELARELSYELRTSEGTVITDINDASNTYWKLSEKCYTLRDEDNKTYKDCKTIYTLENYEERIVGN